MTVSATDSATQIPQTRAGLELWNALAAASDDAQFAAAPPRVVVTRAGEALTTIGGLKELARTREAPGVWTVLWPVPWNAPVGDYLPVLLGRDDLRERLRASAFRVTRRKPVALTPGFVVATLETVAPLATMRVLAPESTTITS